MKKIIRYFANKSHDVRIQLLLATIYGLLDIYGFRGMVSIILKARKMTNSKAVIRKRNRVTAQEGINDNQHSG